MRIYWRDDEVDAWLRPIDGLADLIALWLGEHVLEIGGRIVIVIDEAEVKNRVDHDYAIPAESTRLLDFYVRCLLPLFGDNTHREAARHFRTSPKFVNDMIKLRRETGGLDPKPQSLPPA